ncbi:MULTISPECIES: iron chelate uptake ABC transporter family permease subunit [unclassified Gemella]|uniref:iron chelate uptake ABC transporter family permease subunit n=1 Tax=unclassified Gemella TaxID=2624949 RepID=UPI001C0518A5|nr:MULTISPECIES: iron chelate uptake ABC transporter family permease subunit [unclassified Gemella]MBU0279088.1 iron chelate uptake ABC transporter family permease subunit [Gemella sp. zg-1178]QWQ39187.1 iron chelate uptake ABC transporter family permease subunit [Gemella sp. zg-570]
MQDKQIIKKLLILGFIAIFLISFYIFFDLKSEYIFNLRLKKMLAIVLVCYATGYSTVAFQTVTNNNILTPSIMGLESVYIFLQTLVIFFIGSHSLKKMSTMAEFFSSLLLMIIFSVIVYVLLFEKLSANVNMVVLCGMILGGFFSSLSNFMQVLLDPNEFLILQGKIFASFNTIGYVYLNISAVLILIVIIFSLFFMKKLDVISLGKKTSISLGLNHSLLVKIIFSLIAVLISISTVLVGPMTFLGIIIVSITRHFLPTYKHIYKTICASLIGVILVVSAMLIMEKILAYDTAVSIIINFVGGIYFIYLVIKENRKNARG